MSANKPVVTNVQPHTWGRWTYTLRGYASRRCVDVIQRTRLQILVTGLFAAITFGLFLRVARLEELAEKMAGAGTATQFFSALSQALAGLLGLLIAFLLFSMQRVAQEADSAHSSFNNEFREFIHFTVQRPESLQMFDEIFTRIVNTFALRSRQQLSSRTNFSQWQHMLSGLTVPMEQLNDRITWQDQFYLQQLTLILNNIEESQRALIAQSIAITVYRQMVTIMIKLSALLGASLVGLLLVGPITTPPASRVDSLTISYASGISLAVLIAFLTWTLLLLGELIIATQLLYRDIQVGVRADERHHDS